VSSPWPASISAGCGPATTWRSAKAPTTLRHPEVGELSLRREKLQISGSNGQLLVIYHAEPGTESARSLGLLGSLAASESGFGDEPQTNVGDQGTSG
jgi:MmyB-like transcription regulator ligand binding domain